MNRKRVTIVLWIIAALLAVALVVLLSIPKPTSGLPSIMRIDFHIDTEIPSEGNERWWQTTFITLNGGTIQTGWIDNTNGKGVIIVVDGSVLVFIHSVRCGEPTTLTFGGRYIVDGNIHEWSHSYDDYFC